MTQEQKRSLGKMFNFEDDSGLTGRDHNRLDRASRSGSPDFITVTKDLNRQGKEVGLFYPSWTSSFVQWMNQTPNNNGPMLTKRQGLKKLEGDNQKKLEKLFKDDPAVIGDYRGIFGGNGTTAPTTYHALQQIRGFTNASNSP